jgi:hypothetical protein
MVALRVLANLVFEPAPCAIKYNSTLAKSDLKAGTWSFCSEREKGNGSFTLSRIS